jgi:dipeptidyl aminopeptidase/acylaminoacyl peptidase
VVRRESAHEAPNYFITYDFIHFRQISHINPEEKFNWLTTELINYKQLDGSVTQGILYKPTNFNPNKRYPVIIQFYETFSFRMFEYPSPKYTTARINIPWIVSQDYLVFTPDIHFTRASVSGQVAGEAAYNSVVAGAQYLAKLPYVDGQRIGIQGHSFGGGETNWIIANTRLFAAACDASGTVCNEISAYLSLMDVNGKLGGEFRSQHAEIYHDRIGATLWERPDLYIKASPVLRANFIKTPLLIMDNRADIYWRQGMEMYLALRRLGRKCWLLQYNNGRHDVRGIDAVDFTIRLAQFFDHYLKGAPPPKWMTEGIPYSRKGVDNGLELDLSGKQP